MIVTYCAVSQAVVKVSSRRNRTLARIAGSHRNGHRIRRQGIQYHRDVSAAIFCGGTWPTSHRNSGIVVIIFRGCYIHIRQPRCTQGDGSAIIAGIAVFSCCQVTVCASSQLLIVKVRLVPPLTIRITTLWATFTVTLDAG